MAIYKYRARSQATGRVVRGTAEVESARDLLDHLWQVGYVPLAVQAEDLLARLDRKLRQMGKMRLRDRAILYRQVATMLQAGLPLVVALEVLGGQEGSRIHEVARSLHRRILRGESLAEAMTRVDTSFPQVHVGLIATGEEAGQLHHVMDRLAGAEEKETALRGKLRSALTYPLVVLLVAVAVLLFMVIFVIPTFMGLFEGLDVEMPALTRVLLAVVAFMRSWWYGVLALLLAAGAGALLWARSPGGRQRIDAWLLRMPILGGLISSVLLSRLSRSLAMLIASGLPLLHSLQAAAEAAGNSVLTRAMADVRQGVNRGGTLAETMQWTGVFPRFMVEMVRVGEQTGALEAMLEKVADYYDQQAEEVSANFTSLLEPVLVISVGGLVGFIVISLFLPIFRLLGAVDAGI